MDWRLIAPKFRHSPSVTGQPLASGRLRETVPLEESALGSGLRKLRSEVLCLSQDPPAHPLYSVQTKSSCYLSATLTFHQESFDAVVMGPCTLQKKNTDLTASVSVRLVSVIAVPEKHWANDLVEAGGTHEREHAHVPFKPLSVRYLQKQAYVSFKLSGMYLQKQVLQAVAQNVAGYLQHAGENGWQQTLIFLIHAVRCDASSSTMPIRTPLCMRRIIFHAILMSHYGATPLPQMQTPRQKQCGSRG